MSSKQGLTMEGKIRLVRRIINGELGIGEAEKKTGITRATITGWTRRNETEGARRINARRIM